MRIYKKIILTALAVALLLGATPVLAQLPGRWEGTGRGSCHPPGTTIYPWQRWSGIVTDDSRFFRGEWRDSLGNHGEFRGEIILSSITTAYCRGEWTWDDPSGVSEIAGRFEMWFYIYERRCEGRWTSIYPSPSEYGTMRGRKVE